MIFRVCTGPLGLEEGPGVLSRIFGGYVPLAPPRSGHLIEFQSFRVGTYWRLGAN